MEYAKHRYNIKKYSVFDDNGNSLCDTNSKEELKIYLNLMFGYYKIKKHIIQDIYSSTYSIIK